MDNLITEQIYATIHTLIPGWCDNVYHNYKYITEETNFSKLLCKTYPECYKLKKLQNICFSYKEHSIDETILETELPELIVHNSFKYCVENFPSYTGTYVCNTCKNKIYANKPALVIAGGPSLKTHNHLELLHENRFNGDIFCVTSVLKKLIEHNIIPEYFCSLDAGIDDTNYINHDIVLKNSNKLTGLFSVTILPKTNELFKGKRYFFNPYIETNYGPNISYIFNLMTKCPTMDTGGNIGTNAIMMAYVLGYNPIIIIGLDLSFETYNEMIQYYKNDHQPYWNPIVRKSEWDETKYKVMYNTDFNKEYYIDKVFNSYAEATISMIKTMRKLGCNIVNCTEQGAICNNEIISIPFKEYLMNQEKYISHEYT